MIKVPALHLYRKCFIYLIKVALKEVITATMRTATAPLHHTAWGQEWVGVVGVASATALDTDHHPLSTVLMLTHRSSWYTASSHPRSTLTRSSTSSACTATWRG